LANKENILYARIRKDDTLIRDHFDQVKSSDWAYEIRRLIEIGIKEDKKQKELLENIKKNRN